MSAEWISREELAELRESMLLPEELTDWLDELDFVELIEEEEESELEVLAGLRWRDAIRDCED